jgi:hypothetical protein
VSNLEELTNERNKLGPAWDENVNGRTVADRAEDTFEDLDEGTLFPKGFVGGDDKSIKNIIKASHDVKVTISLMSAEVPSPTGGLLDPEVEGQLLITYEVNKIPLIPQREGEPGDKNLTGWKVRQQIRPTYIQRGQFYSREQVIDILSSLGIEDDPRIDYLLA